MPISLRGSSQIGVKRCKWWASEATYHTKPVALHDCEIKPARQLQELDVLIKLNTRIENSPRKFDVSIENLTQNNFNRIFIIAKVTQISETMKVSSRIAKLGIAIADFTGVVKLTLWEADFGQVREDNTYCFADMMVWSYNDCKHLSMPKEGGSLTHCDDIGEVADDDHGQDDTTIQAAEVAVVITLESYAACIAFKSKVEKTY